MKSLINFALLKEQLKRFYAIALLPLLAYVLLIILPLYSNSYRFENELINIFAMRNPVFIVTSILVPLAAVYVMFSYLFQPKSTTAMHAFPFRRDELLFTNLLAAVILIMVPLIIVSLLLLLKPIMWVSSSMVGNEYIGGMRNFVPVTLFPNGLTNGDVINTIPVVSAFFLRILLCYVFYFAVFLLAMHVSGSAIIFIMLSALFPFIPIAIFMLVQTIAYYFVFGYSINMYYMFFEEIATYTNPILMGTLYEVYYNETIVKISTYISAYTAITVVLIALSIWCNRMRKQERAGDSIVFYPLKNTLVYLISILGMIFMGLFLGNQLKNTLFLYVGFILGFIITYYIAQMITEQTFLVLNKSKAMLKYGGITFALFIVLSIGNRLDITGYSSFVPNLEDVESVCFELPYEQYTGKVKIDDRLFITNPSIVEQTVNVQQEIVNKRKILREVLIQSLVGANYNTGYRNTINQNIIYKLRNGQYVERSYLIPQNIKEETGLDNLLLEDEVILSSYVSLKNPETINKFVFTYVDLDYTKEKNFEVMDKKQIIEVSQEIKKDIILSEHENQKNMKERAMMNSEQGYATAIEEVKKPFLYAYAELSSSQMTGREDYYNLGYDENVIKWLKKYKYIQ